MRDPFAPVVDPCRTAQLSLWRYQGVTQSTQRQIGIMQNGEKKWLRIEVGGRLNAGWRVSEITHEHLAIDVGEGCEPRYWQWKREGTHDDKKDESANAVGRTAVEPGEKHHVGG